MSNFTKIFFAGLKMKQFYILLALATCLVSIRAEYCYNNVISACGAVGK